MNTYLMSTVCVQCIYVVADLDFLLLRPKGEGPLKLERFFHDFFFPSRFF